MESAPYLEGLNERQKEAVLCTNGPLMVLAGAGSGKTRVIAHHIVHLIHQGVPPHNILAVTFTNKAAKEMRERVLALMREFPTSRQSGLDSTPVVTTFHSLGVRLLREHHETLDLRKHFTIYDRGDSVKAVKEALTIAGYSPKQFEPRRILSLISRAKGDAIGREGFAESASSYPERVAAEVWEHYEKLLKKDGALDFDDLLLSTLRLLESYPVVREVLQDRYRYIHIDEYQDTNKVQYEIARLLAGERKNICVVGDIDQCLKKGTLVTMADKSVKKIENVKVGDIVLSNYGSGDLRAATVSGAYRRRANSLVKIKTRGGKSLTTTKDHTHFAGYRYGLSSQWYFTYLMNKKSIGWRLGVSAMYTKGQRRPMPGFMLRTNQEHADAIWILAAHDTPQKARIMEYELSLRFQIPTIPFMARRGRSKGGYVHDQKVIDAIFEKFDTEKSAERLLKDCGLSVSHPHHRPQGHSRSGRRNLILTLCGDRRGKTPMHRISMVGADAATKKALRSLGLSVRPAKSGSASWRFESAHSDYRSLEELVKKITAALPDCVIIKNARLGKAEDGASKNSLPLIPASCIRPGMMLFTDNGYDEVVDVKTEQKSEDVYDIDVTPSHNFIANGIVTHNSIYSWRGADIKNILQFERHFPGAKTVLLEENYRSTKTIIAVSNAIIKQNRNRVDKTVFTSNDEGDKLALISSLTGADEAEFVARESKRLIESGAAPSEIAVLFRTNFQSRALEEAFLNYEVPYQVLGTKFFERKEIKDALSYLRLALNPGSTSDLSRVANTPPRGLGKVTVLKIIEGKPGTITGAAEGKVKKFQSLMMDIAKEARSKKISETLKFILKQSGMEEYYKESGTEDDLARIENLRELVTLSTRYDELAPEEGALALLEDAALQSDQDELKSKEEKDAVRLMTVHAAKGLEFPYVFITGLEEGLFPHERLDDGAVDTEEERRLFYVALTRAGKKVWLSYAHTRTIFGSQRVNIPSSFLSDIDEKYLERDDKAGGFLSGFERVINID